MWRIERHKPKALNTDKKKISGKEKWAISQLTTSMQQ